MKNILLSTIIALTAVTGCSKTDSAKEAAQDAKDATKQATAKTAEAVEHGAAHVKKEASN